MVHLTGLETAIFVVCLAASAYGFGKVWHIVRVSKKDPEFDIHPVGRRVKTFVWEVLLQGKVIQQRPLAGF